MPSTVIRNFAYRPELRELEIMFTTGRCYVFHDVPEAAIAAFRQARSKGRHFNTRIRGRYLITRLSRGEAPPDRPH